MDLYYDKGSTSILQNKFEVTLTQQIQIFFQIFKYSYLTSIPGSLNQVPRDKTMNR